MKKIFAVLLAAVMLLGTVNVFAAPSPGDLTIVFPEGFKAVVDTSAFSEEQAKVLDESTLKLSILTNVDEYINKLKNDNIPFPANLKDVINSINDAKVKTPAVSEAAEKLLSEGKTYNVYDIKGNLLDKTVSLEDVHFVSLIEDLSFETKDGHKFYNLDGKPVPAEVTLIAGCLNGVAKEAIVNYMLMVFNPETGELGFIELVPECYNSPELMLVVPFQGLIALVQK